MPSSQICTTVAAGRRTGMVLVVLLFTFSMPTALGKGLYDFFNDVEPRIFNPPMIPRHNGGGIILSRPVVVHMGPAVDVDFGHNEPAELPVLLRGMMGSPLGGPDIFGGANPFEEMEREMDGFLQRLDNGIGGHHVPSISDGGFQVNQEKGHFKLHASLPGYKMRAAGADGKQDDGNSQPLSVEVVGRNLVVRGRQTSDRMTRSFQRNFRIPQTANSDAIQVTYNNTDGALAVDIPTKEGADEKHDNNDDDVWTFNSQDGGSQTTMTFMSSGGRTAPSFLRGAHKAFPNPSNLLEELLGIGQPERPANLLGAPRQVEDPIIKLLEQLNDGGADMEDEEKHNSPIASKNPSLNSAPVVVHSKNAQPFWRLMDQEGEMPGAKMIEVVAPKGVHTGKPEGRHVPVYNKTGAQEPFHHVELPVNVRGEDCSWAAKGAVKDRVLRCGVDKEVVKKVPIRIFDEL